MTNTITTCYHNQKPNVHDQTHACFKYELNLKKGVQNWL